MGRAKESASRKRGDLGILTVDQHVGKTDARSGGRGGGTDDEVGTTDGRSQRTIQIPLVKCARNKEGNSSRAWTTQRRNLSRSQDPIVELDAVDVNHFGLAIVIGEQQRRRIQ